MKRLFAVARSRGAAWNDALPLEEQAAWPPHAEFMNVLLDEGFVVIGGPLEGTREVLLIIRANDADEIAPGWRAIRGAAWTSCALPASRLGHCDWVRWNRRLHTAACSTICHIILGQNFGAREVFQVCSSEVNQRIGSGPSGAGADSVSIQS
jgi:hypothetical protein